MKRHFHVLGMLALGVAFLAVFVAAQQWRVKAQTRAAGPAPAALTAGIGQSLRAGALDAAKRAAEAGGPAFARVHALVLQARRDLQNDDAARAKRTIDEALAALRDVEGRDMRMQPDLERYAGATLINMRGERIGEVRGIARLEDRAMVEVSIGGVHDAGGFLDFGGRRLRLPREALVFGKPKRVGETLVAWTGRTLSDAGRP